MEREGKAGEERLIGKKQFKVSQFLSMNFPASLYIPKLTSTETSLSRYNSTVKLM